MREFVEKWLGAENVADAYAAGEVLAEMPPAEAYAMLMMGVGKHVRGIQAELAVKAAAAMAAAEAIAAAEAAAAEALAAVADVEVVEVAEPEVVVELEPEVAEEPVAEPEAEVEPEPGPEAVEEVEPEPEPVEEVLVEDLVDAEDESGPTIETEPRFVADAGFGESVTAVMQEAGIQTAADVLARADELEDLEYIGPAKKRKILAWAQG